MNTGRLHLSRDDWQLVSFTIVAFLVITPFIFATWLIDTTTEIKSLLIRFALIALVPSVGLYTRACSLAPEALWRPALRFISWGWIVCVGAFEWLVFLYLVR